MTIVPSNPGSPQNGNWNANGVATATTYTYRWSRCEANGTGCVLLDHSAASYTTTVADSGHTIRAEVIGKIGSTSSDERLAGLSGSIYEPKPTVVTAPRIIGPPYLGSRLQSTAGAWTGTNPTFTRRWLRCNSQGLQCNPTSPVVTSSTYLLRAADRGHTLRLEVTATVQDQFQNRVTTTRSPRTAVINYTPACLRAKARVTQALRGLAAAQRELRQARASGNQTRINRALRHVATARTTLRRARAAVARDC